MPGLCTSVIAAVLLVTTATTSASAAPPMRPVLRHSFVAKVWSLQNSSDSLFVNQTVTIAVSDALGAIAQNQTLKDGRLAKSIGFYGPQSNTSIAGVVALDPFFGRIACYVYPPALPGDPSHMTLNFDMALQLAYAGVDLGLFNGTTYAGMSSVGGKPCELWTRGEGTADTARFCVDRSTGIVLSANHTAYQGSIHEISKSVLTDVVPVESSAPFFAVPDRSSCVDLRALPAANKTTMLLSVAARMNDDDDMLVNDPERIARLNKLAAGAWVAGRDGRDGHDGMTLGQLRAATQAGGIYTSNPHSPQSLLRNYDVASAPSPGTDGLSDEAEAAASATKTATLENDDSPLPESFDARTAWSHCTSIATPRAQGKCGSCWAFASAEALSDRLCVSSKLNVTLSVEYLMDCNIDNNACAGGLLDDSWKFMSSTGLPTESCIPYQETAGPLPTGTIPCGAVQKCLPGGTEKKFQLYSSKGGAYAVGGFTGDAAGMQREIMTHGPISVAFQVFSDFHNYRSGVYARTPAGQLEGGHAVKIIGWGSEGNVPYWWVANSWGPNWGLGGFFKMKRGVNECGIEQTPAAGRIE